MKKMLCCCLILFTLVACNNVSKTSYHQSGFNGEKLYVNTDGETLVFERYEGGTGSLTKKTLLDTFNTVTKIETVVWNVYSTAEYPDLSYILVISGTNSSWTYRLLQETP